MPYISHSTSSATASNDEPFNNPLKKLYHEKRDDSEKARFSINKFKEQDNSGDDKNAKDE